MTHGRETMNPIRFFVVAGLLLVGLVVPPAQAGPVEHVIHISVDGLHPGAVAALGPAEVPNFFRLREEGAFTDNARTDPVLAYTLPNHASQFSGRHALGNEGHGWVLNNDPGAPSTLHLFKSLQTGRKSYIASVFDVVHDHGHSTALFANSSDFAIFDRSWNGANGAPDRTGADNGRDKIDVFFAHGDMTTVATAFVDALAQSRCRYAFLHLGEPDSTGHRETWSLAPGSAYLEAVKSVDAVLGMIFELVDSDPFVGKTAIILTADHSGELGQTFHVLLPPTFVSSGIVPFYVWGPPEVVDAGADLYDLNPDTRGDPGGGIPSASDSPQPIRNGDAANLALTLLGLPAVPGSVINRAQNLSVDGGP